MPIHLTVNGAPHVLEARDGESLLDLLRLQLGIRSPKRGCQPLGQCGACVAIVGGEPRSTCTIPAASCDGMDVRTVEGLPAAERERFARVFAAAGALQCGFCIPGILMRAHHLIEREPEPSRRAIAEALDEHLCRCTGYVKIIDAIEQVARERRGAEPTTPVVEGGVGARLARHDAARYVLGEAPYVDDLERPGMLYGAVALSAHARAKVLRIDVTRARAAPGVRAVLTARDVPGERFNGLIVEDWPVLVAEGEDVHCVGDVMAIVAAETEVQARAAAELVQVEYEPAPIMDIPVIGGSGPAGVHHGRTNTLSRTIIDRGDADAALEASRWVVTGTWQTQRIEHYFLEPECALAVPLGEGRLHLFTQGQGVFDDRRQVARVLGIPEERVFVELVPSGGAFGGKEDLSVQAHAALLAMATGRPVKLALSRKESIRVHPKRHPISITLKVGCDEEGRLTAVHARLFGDTGAYASVGAKVLERAAGHICGPYRVPAVHAEAFAVYTNNPPCGAMRGFGANQAAFAIEGALDRIAATVGIDGWEVRWRNAIEPGDMLTTGQVLDKSVGIRATLLAVRDRYRELRAAGRAVGIACGIKNSGLGNGVVEWGKARLVVEKDATVSLHQGFTEMGQGLFTVVTQIAAEVTGLPAATFRPCVNATFALGCGQTTGSRATLFAGRAVKSAAAKLRADLDAGRSLADLVGNVYAADEVVDDTTAIGSAGRVKTHTTYGFATQLCVLDAEGRLERVIAAHDVGRAINPLLCEGQIQGAIHMGLGYALSEELPCVDGMPLTFSRYQLGILKARDMPEVEVILVEEPEPEGPFGAKGLGEIGLVPTAAAVAGALYAFDGVRRTRLPMKDSPAARALSVGRIRTKAPRETWR
jgi:selenium-dependent xanthine dehydrogenase